MAIDPSISLGVQQPQTMNPQQWAQMALTGQQLQNQQAALPGIQADSAVKQRALEFNSWLSQNRSKYMNADGSINTPLFLNDATSQGYHQEAEGLAANDALRMSAQAKATGDQAGLVTSQAQNVAQLLYNLPKEQQVGALTKWAGQLNKVQPGLGDQITSLYMNTDPKTNQSTVNTDAVKQIKSQSDDIAKATDGKDMSPITADQYDKLSQGATSAQLKILNQRFQPATANTNPATIGTTGQVLPLPPEQYKVDINGVGPNPVPAPQPVPQPAINPATINAWRNTTIAPQAQNEQQMRFAQAGYSPEGMNPESPLSQNFRGVAGVGGVQLPGNMSYFQGQQLGLGGVPAQAVGNQYMPPGVRAGAVAQGAEYQAYHQQTQTAINAAQAAANTEEYDNKIGQIGSSAYNKFTSNPAFAGLTTLVQVHNANPLFKDDQINMWNTTPRQLVQKLQADDAIMQAKIAGQAGVAGSNALPVGTSVPQGSAKYTQSYGTPADVLNRLQGAESSGKATALNPQSKAMGPYQFTPETLKMLHDKGFAFDPMDPVQSRAAADYYLSTLAAQNGGDWTKAVQQYNGQKTDNAANRKYTATVTGQPASSIPAPGGNAPANKVVMINQAGTKVNVKPEDIQAARAKGFILLNGQ